MAVRSPADIRNVVLTGHGGCGKTTLTERLLHATGTIQRMGTVEEGSTVSDWTDEEKKHKHSLQPTVVHFAYEGHDVNLIDTPGMSDFLGHAIACYPAGETVVVMVDASKGVESGTRRLMAVAAERNLPRMLLVNKIDDANADLPGVLAQLRDVFGNVCVPLTLPANGGESAVNVFEETEDSGATPVFSSVEEAHTQIVEQVVEVDESLMEKYLEGGAESLDRKAVHDAFEQAMREGHLVPVCFVSAKTGAGVEPLLHIFASLLPSPLEGNPRPFLKREAEGEEETQFHCEPTPEAKVLAHVFKVTTDPFVGKLGVFRVHQGTIKARDEVLVTGGRKPVRLGHLLRVQGKEHTEVESVGPGDIAAVAKVDEVAFDSVLHQAGAEASVRLRPLPLPKPMYGLAIELKNHADENKFGTVVQKLIAEDPCLVVERVKATRQTVMRGLGELHLRVVLEKFKSHYGIELETAPPKVAYKETIAGKAEGHHRHKKQTGGAGQFGEVYLRVEPLPPDHPEGFEFANEVVGGAVPRQFMPAIEKGVRQAMIDGAFAGYPMTGVRVAVYDGKHHPVDSKEVAFITAGSRAFIDAVHKAKPTLLEPYVALEVTAPSQYMGDITGDLSTKRGRVQDTEMHGSDTCIVRATAPLGELQNYSNELKSMTGGAGSYTMDYSHDEAAPPQVQQEIMAQFKGAHEED